MKERVYYFDCLNVVADEYIAGRLEYLTARYKELTDAAERRAVLMEIQQYQKKLKSKNIRDKI